MTSKKAAKKAASEYAAAQAWARYNLMHSKVCDICGSKDARKYCWSSISGEQKRDSSDWQRLCLSCMKKDNRKRESGNKIKCQYCGSDFISLAPNHLYCSSSCKSSARSIRIKEKTAYYPETKSEKNLIVEIRKAGYNVTERRKWIFWGDYELIISK